MIEHRRLDDTEGLTGEELFREFGPGIKQVLVDLIFNAIRRGNEHQAMAVNRLLREVEEVEDLPIAQPKADLLPLKPPR